MIKVTHVGHACFVVDLNGVKIVFDPYDESIGLSMPQITAEKLFISHEHYDHNNRGAVEIKFVTRLDGPSYTNTEIKSWHDDDGGKKRGQNIIRVVRASTAPEGWPSGETCTICHLGDLGQVLTDEQVNKIQNAARPRLNKQTNDNNVDVLMIPVGGNYTIDAATARNVVRQLKPRITIPMHYKTSQVNLDIAPVDEFLKLMAEDGILVQNLDVNSFIYSPDLKGVIVI
jgi:L-ascorbate metabolism protein UlaG (beta-lactamase superfamily)